MEEVLQAQTRQEKRKAVKALREQGMVPGVVYGQGDEAQLITVSARELDRVYATAGSNRLVEVKRDDDKAVNTLFVEVQTDPLTGDMRHFDLYKVKMDEEIETEIPVQLDGEAPATYNLDGVMMRNLEAIEVRALPNKLPESFHVDLEPLEEINAAVHVSDLDVPEGVEILTEEDELIVKIDPPRSEEELDELDEAIDEDAESAVASEHGEDEEEDGEDGGDSEGQDAEDSPDEDKS